MTTSFVRGILYLLWFLVFAIGSPFHCQVCTALSSSSKESKNSNYYSYKSFKKMALPAVAYSITSNLAGRVLGWKPDKIPPSSTDGKKQRRVALVTGSNTGVGYETAKTLVYDHGFEVIIASRSKEKAVVACKKINEDPRAKTGKAVFVGEPLDLADFDSVRTFGNKVNEMYDQIDVLINNAGRNSGGLPTSSSSSGGSVDLLFQTNFLGHFLLTNLILDKCVRIVNLGSVMHHFPKYSNDDDDNINSTEFWENNALDPSTTAAEPNVDRKTYAPSKLAAILFSIELNRRYGKSKGIRSIAVNPGSVFSDIWRNYPEYMKKLYKLFYLSPEQGCSTSVAASVLDFDDSAIYLQPYRLPFQKPMNKNPPFPLFEMLGPYQGYSVTQPRLPIDGGIEASQSLFSVCEEITNCKYT